MLPAMIHIWDSYVYSNLLACVAVHEASVGLPGGFGYEAAVSKQFLA